MVFLKKEQLPITKQCELLGKSRSWYYYQNYRNPKKVEKDVQDKALILDVYKDYPFYGYRKITLELNDRSIIITRKRVRRLMKELCLYAIYPGPNLSKRNKEHEIYPYLLKDIEITRPNQVWETDITYIPFEFGKLYLVAIIDVYSRKILSWNLSNTMDVDFCTEALFEAIEKYGYPEIFNSDQGSQFTSPRFLKHLKKKTQISMDSKGRALDNVFIERFWRSIKYEDIYLKSYRTIPELRTGIDNYMKFYNEKRFHESLDYKRPDEVYTVSANSVRVAS